VAPNQAADWLESTVGSDYHDLILAGHTAHKVNGHRYEWKGWHRAFDQLSDVLNATLTGQLGSQFAICSPTIAKWDGTEISQDILPDLGLSGCPIVQWLPAGDALDRKVLGLSHLTRIENSGGHRVSHVEYTAMFKKLRSSAKRAGLLR
jgi:hypothetical protein